MLNSLFVQKVSTTGRYADGGGLYLQVAKGGSKTWIFRFKHNNKSRAMGLGPVHTLSLAEAREKAFECRLTLLEGSDPIVQRNALHLQRSMEEAKQAKFKDVAAEYIEMRASGWKNAKHKQQWENTLSTYVFPIFGEISAQQIDTDLVLRVLSPIWTKKTETASRIRNRIELIWDYARAKKMCSGENPARWRGQLDKLLPAPTKIKPKRHFPAMPYKDIGKFLKILRQDQIVTHLALEFTILTATRTQECLCAKWCEINFEESFWHIPGSRMKNGKDFRVPLTPRALEILRVAGTFRQSDYIFPGRDPLKPLSNMCLLQVLRRMNMKYTTHGFRSSFNDWASETTDFSNEVIEIALAHTVKNKVEAAYRRGDMLLKRRHLMNQWSNFCGAEKVEPSVLFALPARHG